VTTRLSVSVIAERLARLAPESYAGWTGETVRDWCEANDIAVTGDLVALADLLAAMDRRVAQRAREALGD
jgi:hypothetical protein